jgi:hypothetical protein
MIASFEMTGMINQMVSFTGALTSAANGIMMLTNLGSIWKNEDISTGEKLL